jgi:hypothetical protein
MDMDYMSNQLSTSTPSKKRLTEVVQLKLANSLGEYHLKGKKYKSTLEKASKALASIIAKQDGKKKKAKE